MNGSSINFFDIPIYRCSPEVLEEEFETAKRKYVDNAKKAVKEPDASFDELLENHFVNENWYPWHYNEIIGWLELYAMIDEQRIRIGANIYFINNLRICRSNKRRIITPYGFRKDGSKRFHSPVIFEFQLTEPYDNKTIFEKLTGALENLMNRAVFKSRYVELNKFFEIGRFVDWVAFFKFATPGTTGWWR